MVLAMEINGVAPWMSAFGVLDPRGAGEYSPRLASDLVCREAHERTTHYTPLHK